MGDDVRPGITARDVSGRWISAARENAEVAGVAETIDFRTVDATAESVEAEAVVADLPFGVRTGDRNLARLYSDFFETLGADWERLVLLTAREDLVPHEPAARWAIRRGRLEVSLLVIE